MSSETEGRRDPKGITGLSVFFTTSTVVALVSGVSLALPVSPPEPMHHGRFVRP